MITLRFQEGDLSQPLLAMRALFWHVRHRDCKGVWGVLMRPKLVNDPHKPTMSVREKAVVPLNHCANMGVAEDANVSGWLVTYYPENFRMTKKVFFPQRGVEGVSMDLKASVMTEGVDEGENPHVDLLDKWEGQPLSIKTDEMGIKIKPYLCQVALFWIKVKK